MKLLLYLLLMLAVSSFGAVPSYTVFRGTGGILVTSNPPTGNITFDGSGIFTSSGTNATIAISTNGVLVMVAATNVNFIIGSNVFLAATNIGSSAHIGINAFTPQPFIQGSVSNFLLTYILPVLTVDTLTVSNLLSAPPWSSVQFNSNGVTRGSAGFIYTNGQVRVADVVIAGQGVEVTAGSFVLNGGDTALVAWNGLGRMRWPTGGVARLEDDFASSFNRLQLGGDTAAFPAIGRTNGDVIILGANGAFKLGGSTNRLIAPAVHIANDGGPGTTLLSLHNPLSEIRWDMAIDSNPQTYFLGLGRVGDATPTMVWELGGNVGINTTNPATTLDVQGRFRASTNVYFPGLLSNALPVAFLATDSQGEVYETAVPTSGASAETNAVLTNLVGTVARNVTNVVSLSTSNATSKPLTNSYTAGVVTVFGVEAGANITTTPNGSNIVVAGGALLNNFFAMGITNIVAADANIVIRTNAGVLTVSNAMASGGAALSGHSNAIPYINGAGTALTYYDNGTSQTNPGFGFNPIQSGGPQGGFGGLMVFANESQGLVTIGNPGVATAFATFATALCVSNRYASGAGAGAEGLFKNDMIKIEAVMVNGANALRPDSTMTRWRVWQFDTGSQTTTSSNDVAELTVGGVLTLAGGLPTNNAAFTITTNNFALDTYYTNTAQRSWVSASVGMTNVLLTEKAWVGLYLDQDGDGTWERTGINVRLQGISALAGVEQLGAFLQPSARFIFTNLGTAANSSIEPNSSQWVKQ